MKKEYLKWLAILIFILLFAWGTYTQNADAAEVRIGMSKAFTHGTEWTGQELLFVHRNWYANIARIGGDEALPDLMRYSVGYRVKWRNEKRVSPYLRLGMAYFEIEPFDLISDVWAYDMAVGSRFFEVLDIEWAHNSTAGRSAQNEGVDMLLIGITVPFGSK